MYAVIFKADINTLDSSYFETATRLRQLAKSKYGCLDFISFTEGDREVALSYWPGLAHIRAWRNDPEHLEAQRLGRDRWYRSYKVEVVKIEREYAKNEQ